MTLLAKDGYIAVVGGDGSRYRPDKQYRLLRKGKVVVRARPHHFNPTTVAPACPVVRRAAGEEPAHRKLGRSLAYDIGFW